MKYRFSGYVLDPAAHRLTGPDGRRISLNSRVFDTLLFLVEHPGELLDKGALMQAVWPDTVVEENNLNQAITALRKVFGEKPGDHRFIVTEPGRGYRFVAPVEEIGDRARTGPATPPANSERPTEPASPQSGQAPTSRLKPLLVTAALVVVPALIVSFLFLRQSVVGPESSPPPEPMTSVLVTPPPAPQSVAVLPFADMSPGQDQAYFADGIAEELLNELSRVEGLHVAGRTSSFSFRDKDQDLPAIGRALNVAHILEGSVRKAADRVRITVQLVKAADGYHVWSQTFDRDLEDIFAIQEEIAVAVTDSLSVTLGVKEALALKREPPSFEAYDTFLEARALTLRQGRDNYAQAIELLEDLVREQPQYAEAWSLLSMAYWSSANVFIADRAEELQVKARAANARALELAPESLASLHSLARSHIEMHQWLKAEQALQEALSLAPGDLESILFYGFFLRTVGRPGDAIEYFRRAVEVEPLALGPSFQLALSYQTHGQTEEARRELERAETLIGDHGLLNGTMLVFAMETGDREKAFQILDIIDQSPLTPAAGREFSIGMRSLYDEPEAAREYLRQHYRDEDFQDPLSRAAIATYASYFDDPELAVELMKVSQRQGTLLFDAVWREIYAPTRRHPGFKDIVREARLEQYWRDSGNWGEFCHPLGEDDFECR